VALSQLLWAIILTKEHLWEYLKTEGLVDGPMEILQEVELFHLVDQFYARALFYAAVGYERARHTCQLIRRNRFQSDLYIRPLVYKSREGIGVHWGPEMEFAIVALPLGTYIESTRGLRVCISSWRRIDDNAIPARGKICGAYVNSALAGDEARANGFDEAIVLTDDGHVAEGAASNIFVVRQGHLITPPVNDNILEGITRATIIELARDLWVETIERRIDRSELYVAEEVFFSGTAFEIAPIVEVDRRTVGSGSIGPLTRRLQQSYSDVARGRTDRGGHWRTPVYRSAVPHGCAEPVSKTQVGGA